MLTAGRFSFFDSSGGFSQKGFRCGVRDAKPRMEPSASARTGWVACEADSTEVLAKPLP